ncbi:MAG: N-6 DNA methylase [Bacteroidales bacterium]|nr:N-6 DNA methylase [Bacteroidales bacterium]
MNKNISQHSTLFNLSFSELKTEAEVETRLLYKLFRDLGYPDIAIVPKQRVKPLTTNDGTKKSEKVVDFILKGSNGLPKVVVEAKDPSINLQDAWGQAASYALSYNKDKDKNEKIQWLLISNGHITSLYKNDSVVPIVTLQLSDFASGAPPYVNLRSFIKYKSIDEISNTGLPFEVIAADKLNQLFSECHDMIWKKEKMNPTDAFFEFCKFIFIKIREDKKRETLNNALESYKLPLTIEWLSAQDATSKHPVRDVLFKQLHQDLETAISKEKKKRIFDKDETLKLSASTCKELIKKFQTINLSSIDEDLNGRMFEVFLNAAVRGRGLGQYFTPRPVVDFMTRIALQRIDFNITTPPKTIDACAGTSGFLIEVMAYMLSRLRDDTRFNDKEKQKIKNVICNECLFGIEANERVARIARINMYLHGDGGSHIFNGDGLDNAPTIEEDMTDEKKDEVKDHAQKIIAESFDLVLSNPPFSMVYKSINDAEERILQQRPLSRNMNTAKSNILFLERYFELLKPGGEMLIVIDDTILNGVTNMDIRHWLLENFVIIGIHSLPFNTFLKANAGVKTSIIHVRKKTDLTESQGHVFMSISNNIGHNNALKDTPEKNNMNDILNAYIEWKRTGILHDVFNENEDKNENLECPEQVWLLPPDELNATRLDAYYYSPDLKTTREYLRKLERDGILTLHLGNHFTIVPKLTKNTKKKLIDGGATFKYIEIGDVTNYGLITKYISGNFDELPTRGEYQVRKGDILLAMNISSRGTVVLVPEEFDEAICTSGFLVIRPKNEIEGYLLWYSLRSEYSRKQIYYLSQTAVQPELRKDVWNNEFLIPFPNNREDAVNIARNFQNSLKSLLNAHEFRFT